MPKLTPKLHELLPAESSLKQQAEKTRKELTQTFEKKRNHFEERLVTYQPNAEDEEATTEEQLSLQTTVKKELKWWSKFMRSAIDASLQVADANTRATADIILEGADEPLAQVIPATALLELEKRLTEIQNLLTHVPTLDPTKGFMPDTAKGTDVYIAREVTRDRTKKVPKVIELAPPTKEHPAQVSLVHEDAVVGKVREQLWSGLITPVEKADMLDRCDALLRAVKQARSRANEVEVDTDLKIGDALLGYIFG